tara:strand:+ start:66 stop:266 length:201 start_codon:yes stop_codon:yes gene_type:complete
MNFKETVALFGGPTKVSNILGLKDKSAKDVRRAINDNQPRANWIPKLKVEAGRRADVLRKYARSKR